MNAIADRYRRHADAFEQKIAAVRAEQWSNQSPCAQWTARDVVGHIVDMHGIMLRPVNRTFPAREEPLAAFRAARAAVEEVLDSPSLAGAPCDTPVGPMTVESQIDQVISDDLVLHGWDLAKATGQDATMDADDVARLWAVQEAIPAEVMVKYRTPGAFGPGIEVYGPEVPVSDDASLQDRLLGFIGRDPGWAGNAR
jgi:uncharacterized protein (TIGR03086 family)